ncbi:MAG: hypothetical protein ACE361_07325 [Aureliella sp.]
MRHKRKRKFGLLSAVFLELASLAGIIAVAQPTMVLSWIGVDLHATTQMSASENPDGAGRFQIGEGTRDNPSDSLRSQALGVRPEPLQGSKEKTFSTYPQKSVWREDHNQTSPLLPQPEGTSFPRVARRQPLTTPMHQPTWDYHYPQYQTFP